MSQNISIFGAALQIVADRTFPSGFSITSFADDADPFDSPSMAIAQNAMGPNGDLVIWQTPNTITLAISVIPESEDDKNLAILYEANRISKNKRRVPMDVITISLVYQSGKVTTFSNGMIIDGPPTTSGTSTGRYKSKTYNFVFEDRTETNTTV